MEPAAKHRAARGLAGLALDRLELGLGVGAVWVSRTGRATAQDRRQLRDRNQDLPGLRALVARDDASALEHVDQAAGPRVADAQAALDHRDGGGLGLDHDARCVLEQIVLVGREVAAAGVDALVFDLLHEQLGIEVGSPCLAQWPVMRAISSSFRKAPWMR